MTALRLAAASAALLLSASWAPALTVVPTSSAGTLASRLIGAGVTLLPDTAQYSGAPGAAGTFTGGLASGLGIDSGILLTTGLAELAVGPNTSSSKGKDHGRPGDTDLTALANYGREESDERFETFDAAVLEFDFTTTGGDLYFNYVFASEEYNEFANTEYNDIFAFFLDGVNLALVPGTTTPVGVNTLNGGNPESDPPTAAVNAGFFIDNSFVEGGDEGWLPSAFALQYDGFTVALTAQALLLAPGSQHHIRLAVADTSDGIFDSAVFLQARTFSDTYTPPPTPAPEPGTLVLLGSGLGLLALAGRRKSPR